MAVEAGGPIGWLDSAGERISVASVLRRIRGSLSKSEARLAAVLLSNYPLAGMQSISAFARQASVSDPTVTRFVTKLGFESYVSFRGALQKELEERLSATGALSGRGTLDDSFESLRGRDVAFFAKELNRSFGALTQDDYLGAVEFLADITKPVFVIGGRVTSVLARHLSWALYLMRPGVTYVDDTIVSRMNTFLEMPEGATVVAFDFRRYEEETLQYVRVASKSMGARIILFTDPYLSPIADLSDVVLLASIESIHPLNSIFPTVALVESLLSRVWLQLGDESADRLKRFIDVSEQVLAPISLSGSTSVDSLPPTILG